MNIVIFGPPGSGKGTQSGKIVKDYNLIKVSTGDLLRDEILKKTNLGKQIQKIIVFLQVVVVLVHLQRY